MVCSMVQKRDRCLLSWQEWEHQVNTGGFRGGRNELKWGKMHYIQIRRLRDVSNFIVK